MVVPAYIYQFNSASANFGKIEGNIGLTGTITSTYNVFYEVKNSLGVVKPIDFAVPDGVVSGASPNLTLPLVDVPTSATGDFIEDTYTHTIILRDQANPSVDFSTTINSFTLDVLNQGPSNCVLQGLIEIDYSCFDFIISAKDSTDYKGATIVSRLLTLQPPTIDSATGTPPAITTTDAIVSDTFMYSGVTYSAVLETVYQKVYNVAFTVVEDIHFTQSEKIICAFQICKLVDCINKELQKIIKKAIGLHGLTNLPKAELEAFLTITNLLVQLNTFISCKNAEGVDMIYKEIQKYVQCDCGCGDGSDEIVLVNPGTSTGNINAVNASLPVVANITGSTLNISVTPSFVAQATRGVAADAGGGGGGGGGVDSLSNTYIGGFDESVLNITPVITSIGVDPDSQTSLAISAPVSGVQTLTFDADPIRWGAWTVLTNAQANNTFGTVDFDNQPQPLRYAFNAFLEQFRMDGNFTYDGFNPNLAICITNADITVPSTMRSSIPMAAWQNGRVVGNVILLKTSTTTARITFVHNTDYVQGDLITVGGIINL